MKILKISSLAFLVFSISLIGYLFLGPSVPAEKIAWGVDFSQKHAENLGLNWQENYLALLDDLGVRHLKISTTWDFLEPQEGQYHFQGLDWQLEQARARGVDVILVLGRKTPRWPECHVPQWARAKAEDQQRETVLGLIRQVVLRYQSNPAIWAWQVENEPLLSFGECPPADKTFLKEEVALVKSLDPGRPVIVSDSGEWSLWFQVARIGDIVGTTLYRTAWVKELGRYADYPFPPVFYHRKAELIEKVFGKRVINIELQAEPWGPQLLYDSPLAEQQKTMTISKFRENLEFARATGLDTFYLWGGEWWYWMKEKQEDSSFWDEAKTIFNR
ncbi:MAG: Endo-1,4-beta-mannosidase [Candidatus Kaiserbacteria bacterium GW2011_GWA2_49_19]|uniref:Endo-1,4-beta-mannosidase n=1 Tax=Candidatus Kaiserbacteria bacterium GW2011_GWA2_49_19 TaxID=1618669 RepID=A0A0G1VPL6_9BACT|nr:MAG: Endo-1,4-beta-mannosidase [Candidatus Kaiserbacteria bacterium GW2011_GWA2_49_19]